MNIRKRLYTSSEVKEILKEKDKEMVRNINDSIQTTQKEILSYVYIEKKSLKEMIRKYSKFFLHIPSQEVNRIIEDIFGTNIPKPGDTDFDIVNILIHKNSFDMYLYNHPDEELKSCACCGNRWYGKKDTGEMCSLCGYTVY